MIDINPYNEKEFKEKFVTTDIYQQLVKDFEVIKFSDNVNYIIDSHEGTSRQWFGDREAHKTLMSVVPFYYLEFLTKHNPEKIYDIGCGWNIFKRYIPNIIGIDSTKLVDKYYADEQGFVDDEYIQSHQEYFESAFSINALHFVPLSKLKIRVLDIMSMVKPNGRMFLAFNLPRMREVDPEFKFKKLDYVENWVRQQFDDMPFVFEVFELPSFDRDEFINGNIRMVMWKKTS